MNFYSGTQKSVRFPTYKTAKWIVPGTYPSSLFGWYYCHRKLFIFIYENAFLSSWCAGRFLLVGWGCGRKDFKEVLTDVQGWFESEASAEFKDVPKTTVIKINAILMEYF